MSSFFTLPASQRKRKRSDPAPKSTGVKRRTQANDDESISGSDISNDDLPARAAEADLSESDDEEEYEDENPAEKRIRLAEQYLANTHKEVLEDGGFDAADVDQENLRRRMGDRLKHDSAENKGKLYKWIGDSLDWTRTTPRVLRSKDVSKSFTGVALHGNHAYAVSKDLHLVKWQAPDLVDADAKGVRQASKWKVVGRSRGRRKQNAARHHHGSILCVAASQDGRFVVTGGADRKLIVWDATTLKPLKVFTHHRDAVTALAFRRGTNQVYTASKDRTVKIWSLNELAYVETLFGHQDEVVDVSALGQEKCVTAGARDRTARLWKVVEESQLVFRGGGAGTTKALQALRRAYDGDSGIELVDEEAHHEGSIDRVAMMDDETFVTASDNGSLSLWNINKKKAIYTLPLAHGLDAAISVDEASAELHPDPDMSERGRGGKRARWVTAIAAVPFSDVFVTGSWDGHIRAWKLSQNKRQIETLGALGGGQGEATDGDVAMGGEDTDASKPLAGVVNDLSVIETGIKGKESLIIAAAVGKEHRLGCWKGFDEGKNCVVMFDVPRKIIPGASDDEKPGETDDDFHSAKEDFEGFD